MAGFNQGFSQGFAAQVGPDVDALSLLTLEQVKALLGITDSEQDLALLAALPVITAELETYCQRGLAYVAGVIEEHTPGRTVTLNRFPLVSVDAITINGAPQVVDTWRMHKWRGQLTHCWGVNCWPACCESVMLVTYTGGYPPTDVPADLAQAFALICADHIGYTVAGHGASSGAGIKSLALGSGALAIGFDTGTTRQGLAGGYDVSSAPPKLQPYVGTLDAYKAHDWGFA